MDARDKRDLRKVGDDMIILGTKYVAARKKAASARMALKLLLAGNIEAVKRENKRIGQDMAIVSLLSLIPEAKQYYEDLEKYEAEYKGLEVLIEAMQTRISLEQTMLRVEEDATRTHSAYAPGR